VRHIVVRTLRREFRISGQAEASPLEYVEACPSIGGAAVAPEIVNIEPDRGFFRARLPSGRLVEGTLRYLTEQFDYFVYSCARADEPDAVSLPAALLVSPDGQRVLFVGGRKSGKTALALGLMSAGWMFEGDERVFIRGNGIVAHPRTLRVPQSLMSRHSCFAHLLGRAPSLAVNGRETVFAIDPRRSGREWRIAAGKIDAVFILENADSVLSTVRRSSSDEAFGHALQLFSSTLPLTARYVSLLRSVVAAPFLFHLQLGALDGAVGRIVETLQAISLPASD
jgi:hypothetical protein